MTDYELPDHVKKRVVVLGVGNTLFGDDGFGPAAVQLVLRSAALPEDVCVLDVGTGIMPVLLDILLSSSGLRRLVILDTVDLGKRPGELVVLRVEDLPRSRSDLFSFHSFSARRILEELENEKCVEVTILACQAESIPSEIKEGLSKAVEDAVQRAAAVVLELVTG